MVPGNIRKTFLAATVCILTAVAFCNAPRTANAELSTSSGVSKKTMEKRFQTWQMALWRDAKAMGVSRKTFKTAFAGVTLDWSLPDLAEKKGKPKRQREFGSPGLYFGERQIYALAQRGAAYRKRYGKTLARIEQRYGVPGAIVLSVWGRETAYGVAKIPHYAVRSLATLAFAGRRRDFFRKEVLAALQILKDGHIARDKMRSSWAGAMGHTQMLPSQFLQYAVDFNGDGKKDIWNNIPDALASTANFLRQKGWQPHLPWGYEVALPNNVNCALEGPDKRVPVATWKKRGVNRVAGRKYSQRALGYPTSLLVPAGRYGPAFIVTKNFYVLKEYNESDVYALFVGHVADRMGANKSFITKWRKVPTYTRDRMKVVQTKMQKLGYNIGDTVDGLVGFRTRSATGLYQLKYKLRQDCWPGAKFIKHLNKTAN
ncbi:MAG: lytic murein transglycosylase [Hyphomicrobiales bacterium]